MEKTMKKIKQGSKTKKLQEAEKVFKESHMMVILEDMRDGIKLLAEGQTGFQRQLDGLTDEVHSFRNETNVKFAKIDAKFEQVDIRFDQMDAEFKEVKANQKITLEHLFNIDERIEALEKEVREIKLELAALGKKILSPEENSSFDKRISVTEKEVKKIWVFINTKTNLESA
jgi:predicted  nucleic acid-binding Zn-ribbon protein